MREKLINMTNELISINSVSKNSNKKIINYCRDFLEKSGFITETTTYNNGADKFNLVAHNGKGQGGLAFIMHIDTVPYIHDSQLKPYIENNRLYGRGACDMKGPIAAALLAGINSETDDSLTYIITADEEIGCFGAKHLVETSNLLKEIKPDVGIITEPTEQKPIYAHKGLADIAVTATGVAAHSSTEMGESANFKIAPFLAEVTKLKERYLTDEEYQNSEFTPASNGLNMVISDNDCALNITAPFSRALITFRTAPNCKSREVIDEIKDAATRYGLSAVSHYIEPIYVDPEHPFVKLSENITGYKAETVPYLTDAFRFNGVLTPIILGPGSIKQAHSKNEYIDVDELEKGYNIYKSFILKYPGQ